jgi:hypothetical protein
MNTCPPLRYWLTALVVTVAVGSAYRLDGAADHDELDAAEAVATDMADAERLAVAAANEAEHRRACTEARGADAIFFTTAQGQHVCRRAPGTAT